MLRVAIVSAGGKAGVHGAAYANMLNAEPVAVMDIQAEEAERLATSLDVPAFTDFDQMMSAVDPDVVDVCAPTAYHKDYVLRSAELGKHIVVEKPMALTMDECREMIDAARLAKVKFMVVQPLRVFPEFSTAGQMAASGSVGTPALVQLARGGGPPRGWHADPQISGGLLIDFMSSDFDWLLSVFGSAERVYAKSLSGRGIEGMDYASVTIRFKTGVIAHVEGNWAYAASGHISRFRIAGDLGMLDFNNRQTATLTVDMEHTIGTPGRMVRESPTMSDPYFQVLQEFIDRVELNEDPGVSPEESMRAVEIGLAAQESIRTGRPVQVGG